MDFVKVLEALRACEALIQSSLADDCRACPKCCGPVRPVLVSGVVVGYDGYACDACGHAVEPVNLRTVKAPGSAQERERLEHCLGMIEQVRGWSPDRLGKAFRWLGYVQGILHSSGLVSLEDIKDMNKPTAADTAREEAAKKEAQKLADHLEAVTPNIYAYEALLRSCVAALRGDLPEPPAEYHPYSILTRELHQRLTHAGNTVEDLGSLLSLAERLERAKHTRKLQRGVSATLMAGMDEADSTEDRIALVLAVDRLEREEGERVAAYLRSAEGFRPAYPPTAPAGAGDSDLQTGGAVVLRRVCDALADRYPGPVECLRGEVERTDTIEDACIKIRSVLGSPALKHLPEGLQLIVAKGGRA